MNRETSISKATQLLHKIEAYETKRKKLRMCCRMRSDQLDEDLIRHPYVVLEVGECLADVVSKKEKIKRLTNNFEKHLKKLYGEKEWDVRVTKELVSDAVQLDSGMRRMSEILASASLYVSKWDALRNSIAEKGTSMRRIADMMTGGLFPNAGVTSGDISVRKSIRK